MGLIEVVISQRVLPIPNVPFAPKVIYYRLFWEVAEKRMLYTDAPIPNAVFDSTNTDTRDLIRMNRNFRD